MTAITSLATLRLRLAEAEVARHRLLTGQLTASVAYDGKSVSFSQANMDKLEAYIAQLKREVAAAEGTPLPRRGPIHMSF